MKIGVLTFSYSGFAHFEEEFRQFGSYSANLGDNAQSIAMRQVLKQIGIGDEDIVLVDRDTIHAYDGEPCVVVMNAVFTDRSFPPSPNITPLFIGFCAKEAVIEKNVDYLKKHEPIGCRDLATKERLEAAGIAAYVSGCITMTLPKRTKEPESPKLLIVFGSGGGELPAGVLRFIPKKLCQTAELISHRQPVWSYPLGAEEAAAIERYEERLLAKYRDEATLVLTPLHHVAAPCLAMGIPVILCRKKKDHRFGFLAKLTPLYTPLKFRWIKWNPKPVDVTEVKRALIDQIRTGLDRLAG